MHCAELVGRSRHDGEPVKGWIIGLAVGGVALVGLVVAGIVEGGASATPAPAAQNLQPGHRYKVDIECPFPIPGLPPAGALSAYAFVGIPNISGVSYMPAPDGKSLEIVFDYTGIAMTLPPLEAGGGTSCTSTLTDMGPSPTVGGTGGGIKGSGPAAQSVALKWGDNDLVKPAPGGQLVITAQGPITNVDFGVAGSASAIGPQNVATITLTGKTGTIYVYGGASSKYVKALSASVTVS